MHSFGLHHGPEARSPLLVQMKHHHEPRFNVHVHLRPLPLPPPTWRRTRQRRPLRFTTVRFPSVDVPLRLSPSFPFLPFHFPLPPPPPLAPRRGSSQLCVSGRGLQNPCRGRTRGVAAHERVVSRRIRRVVASIAHKAYRRRSIDTRRRDGGDEGDQDQGVLQAVPGQVPT